MKIEGQNCVNAPKQVVWESLNDPEILRKALPGCEELRQIAPDAFEAKVRAKIGPVSARFTGSVQLCDIDPPHGYVIVGEGKGGAAGFAKGSARVALTVQDGQSPQTIVSYQVDVQIGGKLAQIGARLIEGAAKSIADEFFRGLTAAIEADRPETSKAEAPSESAAPESDVVQKAAALMPPWLFGIAACGTVALLLWLAV